MSSLLLGISSAPVLHRKSPAETKKTDVRYVEQVQPLAAFVPCSFQVSPWAGGICLGTLQTSMFLMFSSRHVKGGYKWLYPLT